MEPILISSIFYTFFFNLKAFNKLFITISTHNILGTHTWLIIIQLIYEGTKFNYTFLPLLFLRNKNDSIIIKSIPTCLKHSNLDTHKAVFSERIDIDVSDDLIKVTCSRVSGFRDIISCWKVCFDTKFLIPSRSCRPI